MQRTGQEPMAPRDGQLLYFVKRQNMGMSLQVMKGENRILISDVHEDAPKEVKNNLQPGDTIIWVNNMDIRKAAEPDMMQEALIKLILEDFPDGTTFSIRCVTHDRRILWPLQQTEAPAQSQLLGAGELAQGHQGAVDANLGVVAAAYRNGCGVESANTNAAVPQEQILDLIKRGNMGAMEKKEDTGIPSPITFTVTQVADFGLVMKERPEVKGQEVMLLTDYAPDDVKSKLFPGDLIIAVNKIVGVAFPTVDIIEIGMKRQKKLGAKVSIVIIPGIFANGKPPLTVKQRQEVLRHGLKVYADFESPQGPRVTWESVWEECEKYILRRATELTTELRPAVPTGITPNAVASAIYGILNESSDMEVAEYSSSSEEMLSYTSNEVKCKKRKRKKDNRLRCTDQEPKSAQQTLRDKEAQKEEKEGQKKKHKPGHSLFASMHTKKATLSSNGGSTSETGDRKSSFYPPIIKSYSDRNSPASSPDTPYSSAWKQRKRQWAESPELTPSNSNNTDVVEIDDSSNDEVEEIEGLNLEKQALQATISEQSEKISWKEMQLEKCTLQISKMREQLDRMNEKVFQIPEMKKKLKSLSEKVFLKETQLAFNEMQLEKLNKKLSEKDDIFKAIPELTDKDKLVSFSHFKLLALEQLLEKSVAHVKEIKIEVEKKGKSASPCVICLEAEKTIVVLPCKHLCLCVKCSEMWSDNCPMCRSAIHDKMNVFTS